MAADTPNKVEGAFSKNRYLKEKISLNIDNFIWAQISEKIEQTEKFCRNHRSLAKLNIASLKFKFAHMDSYVSIKLFRILSEDWKFEQMVENSSGYLIISPKKEQYKYWLCVMF